MDYIRSDVSIVISVSCFAIVVKRINAQNIKRNKMKGTVTHRLLNNASRSTTKY